MSLNNEQVNVRFVEGNGAYQIGDVAHFDREFADKLIKAGKAVDAGIPYVAQPRARTPAEERMLEEQQALEAKGMDGPAADKSMGGKGKEGFFNKK
jgi:hypothetical protein